MGKVTLLCTAGENYLHVNTHPNSPGFKVVYLKRTQIASGRFIFEERHSENLQFGKGIEGAVLRSQHCSKGPGGCPHGAAVHFVSLTSTSFTPNLMVSALHSSREIDTLKILGVHLKKSTLMHETAH